MVHHIKYCIHFPKNNGISCSNKYYNKIASSDITVALRLVVSLTAGSLHRSLQQMEKRRRGEGNSERKGRGN